MQPTAFAGVNSSAANNIREGRMKYGALMLALLAGLAGCNSDPSNDSAAAGDDVSDRTAQVTGTLMYRERIALPPGAVALVQLSDTSQADMFSYAIAYQEIEDPGSPPIPFVLDYDPSKIDERKQYGIRATISHDGQLLFTSDTHYPVLTRGAGNTADIMLIMVERDR
jgi:putative lipoprotein